MGVRGLGVALISVALAACVGGGGGDGSGGGDGGVGGNNGGNNGGGNNNGGPPPADFDREALAATLAQATCSFIESCGLIDFLQLGAGATCVAEQTADLSDDSFARLEAAIAAGRVSYDAAQAQACLDDFDNRACDSLDVLPEACAAVFVGTIALGDPCELDEECADGACNTDRACPGTCTAFAAAGESCLDAECTAGLACDDADVCVEPAAQGDACGGADGAECGGLQVCDGETEATDSGTCQPLQSIFTAAAGAACDPQAGTLCQTGLSCVVTGATAMGATWECRARASVGGACGFGVPNSCENGAFCEGVDLATGMAEGTCAALPADGEPCNDADGAPECAPGLVCNADHLCVARKRLEGACTEGQECYSGNCADGGTCAAPTGCD